LRWKATTFECVVRLKTNGDSGGIRTVIPGESERVFRVIPNI
jgi:hypothetical protein